MRDVYITLGFFLFAASLLCLWAKVGYDMLLTSMGMAGQGAAPASFIVGAMWGFIFAALFMWFYATGRMASEEIASTNKR